MLEEMRCPIFYLAVASLLWTTSGAWAMQPSEPAGHDRKIR
jgi:hypothetical protein